MNGSARSCHLPMTKDVPTLGPWVPLVLRFSSFSPKCFLASHLTCPRCAVMVITPPPALFSIGVIMVGNCPVRGADRGKQKNVRQMIALELFEQDRRSRRNDNGRS